MTQSEAMAAMPPVKTQAEFDALMEEILRKYPAEKNVPPAPSTPKPRPEVK